MDIAAYTKTTTGKQLLKLLKKYFEKKRVSTEEAREYLCTCEVYTCLAYNGMPKDTVLPDEIANVPAKVAFDRIRCWAEGDDASDILSYSDYMDCKYDAFMSCMNFVTEVE